MGAIQNLIRRYPVAAIAVVVAVAGVGGWTIYQSHQAQQQGAQVLPPPSGPGVPPIRPAPGTAVTPPAPSGAARGVTPTSPGGPASGSGGATPGQTGPSQGAAAPGTTGEGRANPFEPLAGSSGSNPAPGGGVTIPPVPPLPPTAPGGPGQPAVPAAPPAPEYRVVGFVWSDVAFAILEDAQSSYIVSPGDTVKPGIRVISIDVRREIVRLNRDGTPVDLTLSGVRKSP
ncbi:MAG TPA: hypothetical protein VGX97_09390 [bacterium]|nr:hypothetical protein [bacterium]